MLRNAGPRDGSAGEAGGGRAGAAGAAPRCRRGSARLDSTQRLTPGRGGRRAAAARTGTPLARFPPSTRPSAPPVPSPRHCLTARRAAPRRRAGAAHLGSPARKPDPSAARPRPQRRNPAPCARLPPARRRHLGKVSSGRGRGGAAAGRRPADAMTKRSRSGWTSPSGLKPVVWERGRRQERWMSACWRPRISRC